MSTTDPQETNRNVVRRIAAAMSEGDLDALDLPRQPSAAPEPPIAGGA